MPGDSHRMTGPSGQQKQPVKYLRVMLSTDERGLLYRKDFEAANIFDIFVQTFVGELVRDGTIIEGEHYVALIIPRYDPYLRQRPSVRVDPARAAEPRPWISLEFEGAVRPDTPLTFFTLELRVRERSLIYRQDFQLYEIDYFFRRLEQALLRLGVLHHGEYYWRQIFAREDDQADFEREEVYALKQEVTSLVEIAPVQVAAPAFPRKSLSDYVIQETVGAPEDAGPVKILIARPTLEAIQRIARAGVPVEQGGMLVGNVYQESDQSGFLVEITDHILAEEARSSISELRYTFESWQRQTALLRERYPGKRIVGWYHTHLVRMEFYTDEIRQTIHATELFFSRDDMFMHRQFFREKWYVAMVLDPQGNAVFFHWEGDEVVTSRGFYVIQG